MKIGFLGLGQMGAGIAANLLRAGHEVVVWNRSPQKAQPLVADGAVLARTPRDAASGRDIIMTMLADDAALEQVLLGSDGVFEGLPRGALHIAASTIAVATADRMAAWHADRGLRFLSAPVFGRPEAAAAAKLFIVAAGAQSDYTAASALFPAISQKVFYIGAKPSSSSAGTSRFSPQSRHSPRR
jgi:3-hydroxyisobutyrate dehydrogenase-like beta-hydroxyacid dehydrogenase